jgi:hypothetical protein
MIAWVAVAGLLGLASAPVGGPVLDAFRWTRSGDSLALTFAFQNAEKPRYRVKFCPETDPHPCVRVEFAGSDLSSDFLRSAPAWLRRDTTVEPGVLGLRVDLRSPTPARFSWGDDGFHVDILDRVRETKKWPWLGGVGAGVLAGGFAVWWLLDGTATKGNDLIPPPDAQMPH